MLAFVTSSSFLSAWASGAATGLGLFAVVGAQSAFILRQGLMRLHLRAVLLTCGLIDLIFIFASIWGLQALIDKFPWLNQVVLWFGIAFLLWYAGQSARRALRSHTQLPTARQAVPSRRAALLAAIGFSVLNPHFWLDMVIVGSLAHGFADARYGFAAGAFTASIVWLLALGAGSRLLAPLFREPRAWRVLDGLIALIMTGLALGLALKGV